MKKIILILIIALLFPFTANAQTSQAEMSFEYDSSTDNTVKINIFLDTNEATANALTADFTYSSNVVKPILIETDEFFCETIIENDIETVGTVFFSCFNVKGKAFEGNILSVTFDKLSEGNAELKFTDNVAVLSSLTAENILGETEPGLLTIKSDFTVLPMTGDEEEDTPTAAQELNSLIAVVQLVLIIVFAIAGLSIWGGIYFSLKEISHKLPAKANPVKKVTTTKRGKGKKK